MRNEAHSGCGCYVDFASWCACVKIHYSVEDFQFLLHIVCGTLFPLECIYYYVDEITDGSTEDYEGKGAKAGNKNVTWPKLR